MLLALAVGLSTATAERINLDPKQPLPRPDDKTPDTTKKLKVFILMGQSNMVGMGDIGPGTNRGTLVYLTKTEKKYPFLVDDAGQWTVRKDVYYYDARVKKGSPLSPTSNNGKSIGPELGFGYIMGHILDEPVLVLKSCIGNRSLGWDLLPPGSERYQAEVTERGGAKVTKVFAGYKDKPDSWPMDTAKGLATEPPPWLDKKTGKPIEWYAGKQYDDDMANAKAALADLAKVYPGYQGQGYEIAGFVWWQGHKDQNAVHAARYEQNLARLIPTLRRDYNAPNAKFVLATGCGNPGRESFGLQIAEAQLAIADVKKHPEFAGNVKCVDSRDLWREAAVSPKNQGYHYNRNAETYMEVGLRLGWAMAELLQAMN
jgi:alpha-galactosidase